MKSREYDEKKKKLRSSTRPYFEARSFACHSDAVFESVFGPGTVTVTVTVGRKKSCLKYPGPAQPLAKPGPCHAPGRRCQWNMTTSRGWNIVSLAGYENRRMDPDPAAGAGGPPGSPRRLPPRPGPVGGPGPPSQCPGPRPGPGPAQAATGVTVAVARTRTPSRRLPAAKPE